VKTVRHQKIAKEFTSQQAKQAKLLLQSGRHSGDVDFMTWEDWRAHWPGTLGNQVGIALRQEHESQYTPLGLPTVVSKAVSDIVRPSGRLNALPHSVQLLHACQKNAADSVRNAGLRDYLESAQGIAWILERARMIVDENDED